MANDSEIESRKGLVIACGLWRVSIIAMVLAAVLALPYHFWFDSQRFVRPIAPVLFALAGAAMSLFYCLAATAVLGSPAERWPTPAMLEAWGTVRPQRLHKMWFNFLGSAVGWCCAWAVLRPIWLEPSDPALGSRHLLFAVVGLIGVTGWLPYATVGLAGSLKSMADKLAK